MRKVFDDWGFTIGLAFVGAIVMALTGAGPDRDYGRAFVFALVGLVTLTASMVATIMLIGGLGGKDSDNTSFVAAGFLVGIFVTSPIAMSIAFWLTRKILDN